MIDGKMRMVLIHAMTESQFNRENELERSSIMNLQPEDIHGQRICIITGKFLPTYANVQVNEQSGQIGLLFSPQPAHGSNAEQSATEVVSTNKDLASLSSLHWYSPELLQRIYEVKPSDLEFGLGCPFAIKEADLSECSYHSPPLAEPNQDMRL